jgi:hypothetical protein
MRTIDDIANDFVNAVSDEERAALLREMDAINEEIAAAHLAAGHVVEYQQIAGLRTLGSKALSEPTLRTLARMERGEI